MLIPLFFNNFNRENYEELADTVESIRKIMSHDEIPIDEFISTGLAPYLVRLLDAEYYEYPRLLSECAWIIGNLIVGTSDHVNYLLQLGVVQKAFNLLDHELEEVRDNAVLILGNLSGDSFEIRDIILGMDIVDKIMEITDGNAFRVGFLGRLTWLIVNLCRGVPYPPFEKVGNL